MCQYFPVLLSGAQADVSAAGPLTALTPISSHILFMLCLQILRCCFFTNMPEFILLLQNLDNQTVLSILVLALYFFPEPINHHYVHNVSKKDSRAF